MSAKKESYRSVGRSGIRSGGTLTVIGVGGYMASRGASATALIPAALGAPMIGWGVSSYVPILRRVAKPSLGSLALAAMAGSASGLREIPALLSGSAEQPMAVVSKCATFAVGAVLFIKVMKS